VQNNVDLEIAEFIRNKGVTRCPTACALATQGTLSSEDQTQLKRHADELEAARVLRTIGRGRTGRPVAKQ
jgi:hypothetical protein